jgi:small ligand-binding sensory domain FIST
MGPENEPEFTSMPEVVDRERASMLILADPYSFPMDRFLKELNDSLPRVPAVGGMASGGMGPGQNLLITGEGLESGGAVGVVLEGGIEVRSVVSQGCRPVGAPWVVTESHEHMIKGLGGKPALDVLIRTLQDLEPKDQQLFQRQPFLGVAIDPNKSHFERGDFLVRGILGLQAQEKAIAVADTLRRGQTVQFLVRDAESASEDLTHLMDTQGGGALGSPQETHTAGALLFSCNGRGTNMFPGPDHDISAVRSGLKSEVPVAGFFAMGEIGPVGGRNFLHGFTASVAVFRPRK